MGIFSLSLSIIVSLSFFMTVNVLLLSDKYIGPAVDFGYSFMAEFHIDLIGVSLN